MIFNNKMLITFKKRLLFISETEPLSKMSLIVIIVLDIFVVSMIFSGLRDHTALLTSPYEHMPGVCREAILENKWTGDSTTDKIQNLLLSPENSYSYGRKDRLDLSEIDKTHPACQELLSNIRTVKADKNILNVFRQRKTAQQDKTKLTRTFKNSKDVYDTTLLENIAGKSEESSVGAISEKSKDLSRQINRLSSDIASYDTTITTHPSVIEFSKALLKLQNRKDNILADIKQFDFWYPIKELGWQFLFLIPLFGIFYFWNSISIKKNSRLQVLISSHLLVVSFIPILFKVLKLILDIIPHRLLESLFTLLVSLKIIAIWHYIIIFLAIILAIVAIYVIQKKIFSREKIMEKRLMKGSCYSCGKKLPHQITICPFCGTQQQTECQHCKNTTYIAGKYCVQCGRNHFTE